MLKSLVLFNWMASDDDADDLKATVTEKLYAGGLTNRYVSPEWYNIVHDLHFIDAHLHQSIASLFIQNKEFPEFAHSVEVRETDVNVTKIGTLFADQFGPVVMV
ncbi:hypothetical protein LguiB_034283 [Lonicera macranthoides]